MNKLIHSTFVMLTLLSSSLAFADTYSDLYVEGNLVSAIKTSSAPGGSKQVVGYKTTGQGGQILQTVTTVTPCGNIGGGAGACTQEILCEGEDLSHNVNDGRYIAYFQFNEEVDCVDTSYDRTTYPNRVEIPCPTDVDDYGDPTDGYDPYPEHCYDDGDPVVTRVERHETDFLSIFDNPNTDLQLKIFDTHTGSEVASISDSDLGIISNLAQAPEDPYGPSAFNDVKLNAYNGMFCWSQGDTPNLTQKCYNIAARAFAPAPNTAGKPNFTTIGRTSSYIENNSIVLDSAIAANSGQNFANIYTPVLPDTTLSKLSVTLNNNYNRYSFKENVRSLTGYNTDPYTGAQTTPIYTNDIFLKYFDHETATYLEVYHGSSDLNDIVNATNSRGQTNSFVFYTDSRGLVNKWDPVTRVSTATPLTISSPFTVTTFKATPGGQIVWQKVRDYRDPSVKMFDATTGQTTTIMQ